MATRKLLAFESTEGFTQEIAVGDDTSIGKIAFTGVGGVAIDAGGFLISNVATPVSATDVTTKGYVDNLAQGISWKNFARLATAAALPSNTYSNGSSGVGATLTATANGALTVDGTAVAASDRVLVKNEATAANNGIYTVTATGDATHPYILTRALDSDDPSELVAAAVFIDEGTVNVDTALLQTTVAPITIGTTSLTWILFTSTTAITASHGLQKVANDIQVKPGDGIDIVSNSASTNVKLDATAPGLKFTGSAGSGALATKNDTTRGLSVDASGNFVEVLTASGTGFDGSGNLKVVNDANGGLTLGSNGEKILLADASLQTNSSGLSVLYAPAVEAVYTANGAIGAGKAVYWSVNDKLDAAANTSANTSHVVGIAPSAISASATGTIVAHGVASGVLSSATVNTPYYLGATGSPVVFSTLTTGARVIQLGFAKNASDLYVEIKDMGQKQ